MTAIKKPKDMLQTTKDLEDAITSLVQTYQDATGFRVSGVELIRDFDTGTVSDSKVLVVRK